MTVLSIPTRFGHFVRLLPSPTSRVVGYRRTYLLFDSLPDEIVQIFIDPIDGEALADVRTFASASDARKWVNCDIATRALEPRVIQ